MPVEGDSMSEPLEEAFSTYFEEIDRCMTGKCYWALLHLLVVLPAVCAALETDNGDAGGAEYKKWCVGCFGDDATFTASDRYALRCALVHQGRTVTDGGQYRSYTFMQPTPTGEVWHRIVRDLGAGAGPNYVLDVSRMAAETIAAMRRWFADLSKPENTGRLANVRQNIRWLARSGQAAVPITGAVTPTSSGAVIIVHAPMTSTGGYEPPRSTK